MFLRSRFVAIDDKKVHLQGIKSALDAMQLDCHTKLYDDESVGDWEPIPDIRVLFLDLNLTTGATFGTADNKVALAAIQDVITKVISPRAGPYGLILWAENPDVDALRDNLFESFQGDDASYLPVFFASLRKADYINTTSGDLLNSAKLQQDIIDKVAQNPQLMALLSWEADVAAAASAVVRSIVNLVPDESRSTNGFGEELGKIFFRFAQAGAGINQAATQPREAINRVLVPILADRVTEHDPQGDAGETWLEAIIEDNNKFAPVEVQANVNSAIHISRASSAQSVPIEPTDLGAVLEYPFKNVEESLTELFGLNKELICGSSFFGMDSAADWEKCSLKLVQIGAACDHAQPKKGPLLYLLALEWPYDNLDGTKSNGARLYANKTQKMKNLEWRTPTILVNQGSQPGKLSVFLNCTHSATRAMVADWEVSYRLREEITSKLTQEFARNISRPGILTMSPDQ